MKLYFHLLFTFLFLYLIIPFSFSLDDDVKCLQGVKSALNDPKNLLSNWKFDNISVDSICKLTGVACWNEKEDRIISLQLPSMSLSGNLPSSLQYCRSLQSLILSDNKISGEIPPQICDWLPYLVTLDLSGNEFTGSIPIQIENCKFLNSLSLSDNKLSGSIPFEMGRLDRLKRLSLERNQLSGAVPDDLGKFGQSSFSGNAGLCGSVMGSKCGKNGGLKVVLIGGVVGGGASFLLGFMICYWYCRDTKNKKKDCNVDDEKGVKFVGWVGKLGNYKNVQVVLFEKSIVKIRVGDLLVGTSFFSDENIVGSTKTGVTYKAVLKDGSVLGVKRLRGGCNKVNEKEFRMEISRLGELRHPNLVPLLGFCLVENEKLVVFKDMRNVSLHSMLHVCGGGDGGGDEARSVLDWQIRVKIGVGTARGLAWLHHGCQPAIKHQNLCSDVILLDDDLDVRITDFGLVRLMGMGNSNGSSVANGDFGEFGYVPPEYASTLVASLKGDVYGFGVILLELITGQKPLEVSNAREGFKGSLVHWVTYLSSLGKIKDAIDKSLCGKGNDDEIMQLLRVACSCVASRPKDRPSMFRVYESLKNIAENHGFLEQYEEFPMILDEQEID
ncbi:probable inactive receptor kinase At1g27190 [Amaranthus tricolor]|uniref:probable inactive receptor kinase At1g27190 n=1 Tax=Amaranthus tricolor TaxID=29722 RepID=UPI00258A783E|nr:probable inactive receptor kinase At1g27190 [Amaranthus tricolor]